MSVQDENAETACAQMTEEFLDDIDGLKCSVAQYRENLRSIISACQGRLDTSLRMDRGKTK